MSVTGARTAADATRSVKLLARAPLAGARSGGELRLLVEAFNDMLARIESRDVELTQALTQREEANRRLARSIDDLERFAFVASHDLQEPLRMITVYSQLLVRKYPEATDGQMAAFVDHIVRGSDRMRDLLADLRAAGETNAILQRARAVPSRTIFPAALARLPTEGDRVAVTLRMAVMTGWAPGH